MPVAEDDCAPPSEGGQRFLGRVAGDCDRPRQPPRSSRARSGRCGRSAFHNTPRLVHLPPSGSLPAGRERETTYRAVRRVGRRSRSCRHRRWRIPPRVTSRHSALQRWTTSPPGWRGRRPRSARCSSDVAPRRFRDEGGRLLYDLGARPRDRTAARRRRRACLPKWDSPLLAYAPPERSRILAGRVPQACDRTERRRRGRRFSSTASWPARGRSTKAAFSSSRSGGCPPRHVTRSRRRASGYWASFREPGATQGGPEPGAARAPAPARAGEAQRPRARSSASAASRTSTRRTRYIRLG